MRRICTLASIALVAFLVTSCETPTITPGQPALHGDITFEIGSGIETTPWRVIDKGKRLFRNGDSMAILLAVLGYQGSEVSLFIVRKSDMKREVLINDVRTGTEAHLWTKNFLWKKTEGEPEEWVAELRVGFVSRQYEFVVTK